MNLNSFFFGVFVVFFCVFCFWRLPVLLVKW